MVSSWNMIMMRTYFQGIPESLSESARIDGANDISILFRIVIPCAVPIMAVMRILFSWGARGARGWGAVVLHGSDVTPHSSGLGLVTM